MSAVKVRKAIVSKRCSDQDDIWSLMNKIATANPFKHVEHECELGIRFQNKQSDFPRNQDPSK
jgi:hypothetical protein